MSAVVARRRGAPAWQESPPFRPIADRAANGIGIRGAEQARWKQETCRRARSFAHRGGLIQRYPNEYHADLK